MYGNLYIITFFMITGKRAASLGSSLHDVIDWALVLTAPIQQHGTFGYFTIKLWHACSSWCIKSPVHV